MDLVYMLKAGNFNPDLKYSLRSVQKYVNYDNIWVVGFKPFWLKNVNYIKVPQDRSKYKNSLRNVITACLSNDISDDFILMNDDFIAHKKVNVETDLNLCLGTLQDKINRFKDQETSTWRSGFQIIYDLLSKLKSEHFTDFEAHVPMIFNKHKFLEMFKNQKLLEYVEKYPILHYRTLYGNLYYNNPKSIKDVKLKKEHDLENELSIDKWISVFDNVIENKKYPVLNNFLKQFSEKSIYEP